MATIWQSIDVVLLECVADGDAIRLDRLIGTADYINRAIYYPAEMEGGLRRLLGSHLLEESNLRFTITSVGQAVRAAAPSGSVYQRMAWTQAYLNRCVECTPANEWSLSTDAYEAALALYRADMQAAIDRTK